MKKTIPFDLFGEKQELCFTITTLGDFEKLMGKSIPAIVKSEDVGVLFCVNALQICLKRLNPHLYIEKIEKYLDEGGSLDELGTKIIHAIAVTNVLGKTAGDNVMKIYYPELFKDVENTEQQIEEGKNV